MSGADTETTPKQTRIALIADDDKDLRDLMAETMQELGYSSIVVEDGQACIDKLKENIPVDVVFLDVRAALEG